MRKLISGISLAIAVLFFTASSASAHTELQKSNPSDGQVVTAPLERIELTFSEPPLIEGSKISLADATGTIIATGNTGLDGSTLYVPWPVDVPVGDVTVNWRAAADDGHVIDGTFTFSYTGESSPHVSNSATPINSAVPTDVVIDTPTAIATPLAVATGSTSDDNNPPRFLPILLGLAVLGAGAWALTRKKSDK